MDVLQDYLVHLIYRTNWGSKEKKEENPDKGCLLFRRDLFSLFTVDTFLTGFSFFFPGGLLSSSSYSFGYFLLVLFFSDSVRNYGQFRMHL